jgi:hypothetical protein
MIKTPHTSRSTASRASLQTYYTLRTFRKSQVTAVVEGVRRVQQAMILGCCSRVLAWADRRQSIGIRLVRAFADLPTSGWSSVTRP